MKGITHRRHLAAQLPSLLIVIIVAFALIGAISACGPGGSTTAQTPTPRATASLPPLKGAVAVFVVADDLGGARSGVDEREAAFTTVMNAAWEEGAGLVYATLDRSGVAHIEFATLCVARGVNGTFAEMARTSMSAAMLEKFRTADEKRDGRGTRNVLRGLRDLQSELRGLGQSYQALVMSSGVMRRPIDLVAHPQFLADPAATADKLLHAGYLPGLGGTWSVAFLVPASLSDEDSLALRALWWAVLDGAKGHLTAFSASIVSFPLSALAKPPTPGVVEIPVPGRLTVRINDSVLFAFDEARLLPGGREVIANVATTLSVRYPKGRVLITGFTDSTGPAAYNLRLSHRRAEAVAHALVAVGVASARLTVRGCGASDPIASNDSPDGRRLNRRVEVVIATS